MTLSELQSMTVIQLRKLARENNVVLGAGIDKAAIVGKIAAAMGISVAPQQQSILDLPELSAASAPAEKAAPVLAESVVSYEPLSEASAPAAEEEAAPAEEVPVPAEDTAPAEEGPAPEEEVPAPKAEAPAAPAHFRTEDF